MPEQVILLCPCCASTVDADDNNGKPQQIECVSCGQTWVMVVDHDRQAAHSLS